MQPRPSWNPPVPEEAWCRRSQKLESAPVEPLSTAVPDVPEGDSPQSRVQRLARHFGWTGPIERKRETIEWRKSIPFLLIQLSPLAIFFVGFSWIALAVAFLFWFVRMFAITGFYHRYFSHKSFKTSRAMQAVMAFWGGLAVQKGALWWAAHHRDHHRYSDQDEDIHSPVRHGFLWSHVGWVLSSLSKPTNFERVKELARFPELRFLEQAPLDSVALRRSGHVSARQGARGLGARARHERLADARVGLLRLDRRALPHAPTRSTRSRTSSGRGATTRATTAATTGSSRCSRWARGGTTTTTSTRRRRAWASSGTSSTSPGGVCG